MTAAVLSAGHDDTPEFEEPWQARAFAIVNLLVQDGVLTASDWSNCLGGKRDVDAAVDQGYWYDWLESIEGLLQGEGILTDAHIRSAISAIIDARVHRHAAAPEPLFVDRSRARQGA
jgi:hypothetical protein